MWLLCIRGIWWKTLRRRNKHLKTEHPTSSVQNNLPISTFLLCFNYVRWNKNWIWRRKIGVKIVIYSKYTGKFILRNFKIRFEISTNKSNAITVCIFFTAVSKAKEGKHVHLHHIPREEYTAQLTRCPEPEHSVSHV